MGKRWIEENWLARNVNKDGEEIGYSATVKMWEVNSGHREGQREL